MVVRKVTPYTPRLFCRIASVRFKKVVLNRYTKRSKGSTADFDKLSGACGGSMKATGYKDLIKDAGCGLFAPLACALSELSLGSHEHHRELQFGGAMQQTLAPVLLASQHQIVKALDESFTAGG